MNSDPPNLIFSLEGKIQGRKMLIPVTWAGCHSQSKTLPVQIKASVVQIIQILTILYRSHILTTTGEPYMIELWRWVKLMGVFGCRRAASWHEADYRVQQCILVANRKITGTVGKICSACDIFVGLSSVVCIMENVIKTDPKFCRWSWCVAENWPGTY